MDELPCRQFWVGELTARQERGLPWRTSRLTLRKHAGEPSLVALVRAGAVFHKGKLLERPVHITPREPAESTETEVPETPQSTVLAIPLTLRARALSHPGGSHRCW
jgi:hypothetical protein